MTGAETALLVGKVAAPFAGKVAGKLATSAIYRRWLEHRIHKRSPFQYPRKQMRSWLKTVKVIDLEETVEIAGARLALSLDVWLEETDRGWTSVPARGSRVRHLVEALYVEILAVEGRVRGQQLRELWARRRNDAMVAALVEAGRGHSGFDDIDLAVWLRLRSTERRRLRLTPFDLDPDQVAQSLGRLQEQDPNVVAGTVCLLVGPFGSGKSELAEEWHRRRIDDLERDQSDTVPIPVWLDAYAVSSEDLVRAIGEQVGRLDYRSRGVAVVVDGLDEVPGAVAVALDRNARLLVAGDKRSSVLLTTREGVLQPSEEDVRVAELADDDVRELVDGLAGNHSTWKWSKELLQTARRPFFALAAASVLGSGAAPRGQVELLVKLVEQALSRGVTGGGDPALYAVMTKAAVELTRSGGKSDGLVFQERRQALGTMLMVASHDGDHVRFPLPIFEQWFAANGLISDDGLVAEALAGPGAFDRWRWALAIALLGADKTRCDQLMTAALGANPGVGAWLVEQVAPRQRLWVDDSEADLDPGDARQRLLLAVRTWIDSIGNLAPEVLPMRSAGDPVRIGLSVSGRRISFGWGNPGTGDEVLELPAGVAPFAPPIPDWLHHFSGSVANGVLWPWVFVRDLIAGSTLKALNQSDAFGPTGGVWSRENRYRVARAIMGVGSVFHPQIKRLEVLAKAEALAARVGPTEFRLKVGLVTFRYGALEDLIQWLKGETFEHLERPLPMPDNLPGGGTVEGCYTDQRKAEFAAEMLGNGLEAYDEITDTLLEKFQWTLGLKANGPVGAVGAVRFHSTGFKEATLTYRLLPMSLMAPYLDSSSYLISQNGRAAIYPNWDTWPDRAEFEDRFGLKEAAEGWYSTHIDLGPFATLRSSNSGIAFQHPRPASLFAADAAFSDLQGLSLGTGTFPQMQW